MTQNLPPSNGQGELPDVLVQAFQAIGPINQQDLQFYRFLLSQNMSPEEAAMHVRIYRELQRSVRP